MPQESQVESSEHQDDSNIHCQPFPESVSEEQQIYTDYDGCHRQNVKHGSYLSAHFSSVSPRTNQPHDWLNAFPSLRGLSLSETLGQPVARPAIGSTGAS
jgi:hypothetical protein